MMTHQQQPQNYNDSDDVFRTPTPGGAPDLYTMFRLLRQDMQGVKEDVSEVKDQLDKMDEKYVTQEAFWPVKTIVYGGAGIILVAVLTALVALVVIQSDIRKAALRGGFPANNGPESTFATVEMGR